MLNKNQRFVSRVRYPVERNREIMVGGIFSYG